MTSYESESAGEQEQTSADDAGMLYGIPLKLRTFSAHTELVETFIRPRFIDQVAERFNRHRATYTALGGVMLGGIGFTTGGIVFGRK